MSQNRYAGTLPVVVKAKTLAGYFFDGQDTAKAERFGEWAEAVIPDGSRTKRYSVARIQAGLDFLLEHGARARMFKTISEARRELTTEASTTGGGVKND